MPGPVPFGSRAEGKAPKVDSDRLLTRPFVFCSLSNFLQGVGFSLFFHIPGFYAELGAGPVVIGWMFAATPTRSRYSLAWWSSGHRNASGGAPWRSLPDLPISG